MTQEEIWFVPFRACEVLDDRFVRYFRLDEFEKFDVSSFASDKVRYLSFDSRGPVLADEL